MKKKLKKGVDKEQETAPRLDAELFRGYNIGRRDTVHTGSPALRNKAKAADQGVS